MPISPLNKWSSDYTDKNKKLFDKLAKEDKNATTEFWQTFIDDNSKNCQVASPVIAAPSKPTLNKSAINPIFALPGTPPVTATMLALEWFKYWSSSTWSMAAPAPVPFSLVTAIVIDPASLTGAQATLQAALTMEFAVPSKELDMKAKAIGNAFFTASSSLMVNIIGLSKSAPPAPLIIPAKIS